MSSSPLKEPFKLAYVGYCPHPETVHIRGHIKVCILYICIYIYFFFVHIIQLLQSGGSIQGVWTNPSLFARDL